LKNRPSFRDEIDKEWLYEKMSIITGKPHNEK
jgi:hypothetical protein